MAHLILLGDSIFDNASYVPNEPAVIEQVQELLPPGDTALLRAIDGDKIAGVYRQLEQLPAATTHLFLSVGGNDALQAAYQIIPSGELVTLRLDELVAMKQRFEKDYQALLETVLSYGKDTIVCTIYDRCPVEGRPMKQLIYTLLPMFNDCILRQAAQAGLPVIDLRVLCQDRTDFSALSPIEPSVKGGKKIAKAIVEITQSYPFKSDHESGNKSGKTWLFC